MALNILNWLKSGEPPSVEDFAAFTLKLKAEQDACPAPAEEPVPKKDRYKKMVKRMCQDLTPIMQNPPPEETRSRKEQVLARLRHEIEEIYKPKKSTSKLPTEALPPEKLTYKVPSSNHTIKMILEQASAYLQEPEFLAQFPWLKE